MFRKREPHITHGKSFISLILLLAFSMMLTSCGSSGQTEAEAEAETTAETVTEAEAGNGSGLEDRDTLYQVSLLQDLTQGDYYGSVPVSTLKEKGDIGLGTFNRLNGELIMLDGKVYRADGDGTVEEVEDDETIPFASVTFLDEDGKDDLSDIEDLNALISVLDEKYTKEFGNYFQMVRIDGTFDVMNVRSEPAQDEPYRTLAEVMDTDQKFFDYTDVRGTIVGLYCPVYMDKMNSAGWHFHFISEDRTKGGHIVDMKLKEGTVTWDKTTGLNMVLPDEESFRDYDFSTDQSEDVKKVEKPEE